MPMALMRASDLGARGDETPAELDANPALMARIEAVRLEAGRRMGLGDVRDSVLPKRAAGAGRAAMALRSRYFTPRSCHRSHAATGAVGVACAFLIPGTVAHGFGGPEPAAGSRGVRIEHPSGAMDIEVELGDDGVSIRRAGLVRTARKIMKGCCTCPIPFPAPSRRGRQSKTGDIPCIPVLSPRPAPRPCCCSTPRRHPPPIRSGCSPWSCPRPPAAAMTCWPASLARRWANCLARPSWW